MPYIPVAVVESGGGSGGGLFDAYAQVSYTQPQGTDGGSSTGGSDQVFPINTEDFDPSGLLSLPGSNQIDLTVGTYWVEGWLMVTQPNARARSKLRNVTDGSDLVYGRSYYHAGTTLQFSDYVPLRGRFTIASTKTLELHYIIQGAGTNTEGLGISTNMFGPEKYAELTFWREA